MPPPPPPLVEVPRSVNPASARELTGGSPLALTSQAIRATAIDFTRSANSLLQSDNLVFLDQGPFTRAETSCAGDTCATNFGGGPASLSLSDFDFDDPGLEYQAVMSHRGVSLVQVSERERIGDTPVDVFGYGGWLEHSFFAVRAGVFGGDDSNRAGIVDSFVLGNATGTNPTSGSGRWSGVMVGADVSATGARGHVIQGEAAITIRDFLNPMVDVGFSNVFDLEAGTTRPDMNWQDIPLASGSFQSGSGRNQISGQFYGPNHEEVGGVFERNQVIGAFGAKRE